MKRKIVFNNSESLEEWEKTVLRIYNESYAVFLRKRHDYGTENVNILGLRGVFVRIWDKAWRLKNLVWENKEPRNESLEDTFIDIMNYCIIALSLMRRGEW